LQLGPAKRVSDGTFFDKSDVRDIPVLQEFAQRWRTNALYNLNERIISGKLGNFYQWVSLFRT
jgi:hypothetical protein